ncbi:MAG: zinc-ribbon domain-containing protein [Methanomassiliicoccales archaeon]|nr:MAG: zinc-ribbon domain-containing protein [Methanomassiliicoccales archaeon]
MAYCQKCGKQNEDGAQFCNKCGATLMGPPRDYKKQREDKCEEECAGSPRGSSIFWGVIIALIGLWIVFEFGIKNISGMPDWVYDFEFWWIIPVIIGLAIIIAGLKMVMKKNQSL